MPVYFSTVITLYTTNRICLINWTVFLVFSAVLSVHTTRRGAIYNLLSYTQLHHKRPWSLPKPQSSWLRTGGPRSFPVGRAQTGYRWTRRSEGGGLGWEGVGVEMMVKFRFGTRVDPRCLNRTCLRFEADTGNCKSTLRPDNTLNSDCFTVAYL